MLRLLIDSHAHLTSSEISQEVEAVLNRAQMAGLASIVNICTDPASLEAGLKLAERHPWIYNTAATTPHDVDKEGEAAFPIIAQCARDKRLAAIGETGLDYHYQHSAVATQKHFLRRYLHLALECQLPVVIHCREAFADLFEILDAEYTVNGKHAPGVLHCFTGTIAEAEQVFKRGWFLSISGIATFKKSEELRAVVKMAPLEQLLIETDSPYLAPQSKRGKPNEPAYLPEIAALIASLKNVSTEEAALQTARNASRLFNIRVSFDNNSQTSIS